GREGARHQLAHPLPFRLRIDPQEVTEVPGDGELALADRLELLAHLARDRQATLRIERQRIAALEHLPINPSRFDPVRPRPTGAGPCASAGKPVRPCGKWAPSPSNTRYLPLNLWKLSALDLSGCWQLNPPSPTLSHDFPPTVGEYCNR